MKRRIAYGALLASLLSVTSAVAQCAGDCDLGGSVAVNELVLGVNIALDRAAIDDCTSLDANGDGRVAVNELVVAVNNALRGCVSDSTATPTAPQTLATSTATQTSTTALPNSPTVTPVSTPTASSTLVGATATPTQTPETIGGVSTRMLGTFTGSAMIDTQTFPASLRIEVNENGVVATDISATPYIFPNPVVMSVVSTTALVYELDGPPLVRFTLALNDQEHVIGRYTNDDPDTPQIVDYDVVRVP